LELGRLLATPGALAAFAEARETPISYLARHATGDWGSLDEHDKAANEEALRVGARILSAYRLSTGERIWIITEADRSSTTLLLPDEY
jgi:hypothetical protein